MPSVSPETRTLPTSRAQTSATENWMNWRANVQILFRAPSLASFSSHFVLSWGRQVGRSVRIRPMPTGRASCSPTRSAWKRICMGWVPTFVPSFGLSLDAEGMCGPLSSGPSSRTLLTHFPASSLGRTRKSTFFVLNAHSGRRPRYSMLSSIRARCRPASRGTTMTSPVCTGTNTGSLRSRTSVCWQALSSTKRSSSGKPRRGTIWPGLEAFGYALQTPTSLRFEATTGTCARCSLAKLHRSIR